MFCLYIKHAEFWTPVLLKTEDGRAAAAFASRELADSFVAQIGFPDPVEIIAAEQLGTRDYPYPENWKRSATRSCLKAAAHSNPTFAIAKRSRQTITS